MKPGNEEDERAVERVWVELSEIILVEQSGKGLVVDDNDDACSFQPRPDPRAKCTRLQNAGML